MEVYLEPGTYVIAVSGGVDSMVLLDLLAKRAKSQKLKVKSFEPSALSLQLVVAHFDHGIRSESAEDREFVAKAAKAYGLQFEYAEGRLGPGTSEEAARNARYAFLSGLQEKYAAAGIITAHHQDDLLETALLNMLRGTGRKGLTSLRDTPELRRPLLRHAKSEIRGYAATHGIEWREDRTNSDTAYLRNYIRKHLIPKLSEAQRSDFASELQKLSETNELFDKEIADYLQLEGSNRQSLRKYQFTMLPHDLGREAIAAWLRHNGIREFDRKTIERLTIAAKTLRPGQQTDINKSSHMRVGKTVLTIEP